MTPRPCPRGARPRPLRRTRSASSQRSPSRSRGGPATRRPRPVEQTTRRRTRSLPRRSRRPRPSPPWTVAWRSTPHLRTMADPPLLRTMVSGKGAARCVLRCGARLPRRRSTFRSCLGGGPARATPASRWLQALPILQTTDTLASCESRPPPPYCCPYPSPYRTLSSLRPRQRRLSKAFGGICLVLTRARAAGRPRGAPALPCRRAIPRLRARAAHLAPLQVARFCRGAPAC